MKTITHLAKIKKRKAEKKRNTSYLAPFGPVIEGLVVS